MTFGVAPIDLIPEAHRRRIVARALELTAERIPRDREPARIARRPQAAVEVVVEKLQARSVLRQRSVAADPSALNRARIADELVEPHVAFDDGLVDVDEIGAARVDVAADAHVASHERAAGKQRDVALDLGTGEPAAPGDVEIAGQLDSAEIARAVEVLRLHAGRQQAAGEKKRNE